MENYKTIQQTDIENVSELKDGELGLAIFKAHAKVGLDRASQTTNV